MHTGPVPGSYLDNWKKAKITNIYFKCRKCGSKNISYRNWESACGGYEDIEYKCEDCNYKWWVEGIDS